MTYGGLTAAFGNLSIAANTTTTTIGGWSTVSSGYTTYLGTSGHTSTIGNYSGTLYVAPEVAEPTRLDKLRKRVDELCAHGRSLMEAA